MGYISCFENTQIDDLPAEWKSKETRDELESFLNLSWKNREIIFDDGENSSGQRFLTFTKDGIKTTNYVGIISFKGVRLNVFPKVFSSAGSDKRSIDSDDAIKYSDLFIYNITEKWLRYDKKNLFRFVKYLAKDSRPNDLKELYIMLYAYLVKSALDRDAYYQYEEIVEDRQTIKGKIDFNDYASRKYPGGRLNVFNCTYSSFEFDNTLNRIIKYVSGRLYKATESAKTKRMFREIQAKLSEVSDVPCTAKDCDKVHLNRFNEEYRDILSLSRMFLCGESISYDNAGNDSYCFLFPMEKLYENFVSGYFKENFVSGYFKSNYESSLKVRLQYGAKNYVFDDIVRSGVSTGKKAFEMKNDIFVSSGQGKIILDTKYKLLPTFHDLSPDELKNLMLENVSIGDIYQMLTYAAKRDVEDVFLLYPQSKDEEPYFDDIHGTFKPASGKEIKIHLVKIPFVYDNKSEQDHTEEDLEKIAKAIVKYVEPETDLKTKAAIF